jgi:hypothetical protein
MMFDIDVQSIRPAAQRFASCCGALGEETMNQLSAHIYVAM